MKKPFLIIGRAWKFVEFMTPTVNSIYEHHCKNHFDLIVLENRSSRSRSIQCYLSQLVHGGLLDGAVLADGNYWSYIFNSVAFFKERLLDYENIVFTDMDLDVRGYTNWLFDIKNILDNNENVGAISIDVEQDPPYSDGFIFCESLKEHPQIPGFYVSPIDLGFYMVRSKEFYDNFSLPGSHGYNAIMQGKGKLLGKVNIKAQHFGWFRSRPEYREAYSETGIEFGENIKENNSQYYGKQCESHSVTKDNFLFEGPFFRQET